MNIPFDCNTYFVWLSKCLKCYETHLGRHHITDYYIVISIYAINSTDFKVE